MNDEVSEALSNDQDKREEKKIKVRQLKEPFIRSGEKESRNPHASSFASNGSRQGDSGNKRKQSR